jgi:pimaricinolide synthase PimS1
LILARALTIDDAAKIITLRSKALTALAGSGGMASVSLPVEQVEQLVAAANGQLTIAAINSPLSAVICGASEPLADFVAQCHSNGVRAHRIPVGYASHSPDVETIRAHLVQSLSDIRPTTSETPFYSTVTGAFLDTAELTAEYWYENLRQPVRFASTVGTLIELGHQVFVEVSPHPVLTTAIEETLAAANSTGVVTETLRRDLEPIPFS